MNNLKEKSQDLFKQGYSCSESVVRAAYENKLLDQNIDPNFLNKICSSFSAGMGESGCLCGAVAGAQIVLGSAFGREDNTMPAKEIKQVSKDFIEKFKQKRKATCCRVLSKDYDFNSPERRLNCLNIVGDTAEILESYIYSAL